MAFSRSTADLHSAAERLQQLMAFSPAVIYSVWPSSVFRLTFVTENVTTLLGFAAHDFCEDAEFWRNHLHPEDAQWVVEEKKHLIRQGGGSSEYRFLAKDGNFRWIRDEMRLVNDPAGNSVEWVGSWIDITDWKKVTVPHQKNEALNQIILEATSTSIMVVDPDGKIITTNEAMARNFGKEPDVMVGTRIYDLLSPEFAEFRKKYIDETFSTGKEVVFEDFRNGIWHESNFQPVFDAQGKVSLVVASVWDITERKQREIALQESEERYRTLAEAAHDLIFIIDYQDRIQYVNLFAATCLGLTPHEIVGKKRSDFYEISFNPQGKDIIRSIIATGVANYNESEARFPGGLKWLRTWLVPLKDAQGEVSAVLGVAHDITGLKQA